MSENRDTPIDVALVDGAISLGRRSLIKIGAGLLAGLAAVCKGACAGPPPSPVDRMPLPRGDPTIARPFGTLIGTSTSYRHIPEEKLAELRSFRPGGLGSFTPYQTVKYQWPPPVGAPRLRYRGDRWEEVLPRDTMAELMRLHARDEAPR